MFDVNLKTSVKQADDRLFLPMGDAILSRDRTLLWKRNCAALLTRRIALILSGMRFIMPDQPRPDDVTVFVCRRLGIHTTRPQMVCHEL